MINVNRKSECTTRKNNRSLLLSLELVHGSKQQYGHAASRQTHAEPHNQHRPHSRVEVGGDQIEQERRVAEREEEGGE